MANYAYIYLTAPISEQRLDNLLTTAVLNDLPAGWQVRRASWQDEGPVWMVEIPGTAVDDWREANRRVLAAGDDVGFPVALQDGGKTIAFRHGPNRFERWAQGCAEEALADQLGAGVFYDATDETRPPGTRQYRQVLTFREYLARNFLKPLSADDEAYIERSKDIVPDGYWWRVG